VVYQYQREAKRQQISYAGRRIIFCVFHLTHELENSQNLRVEKFFDTRPTFCDGFFLKLRCVAAGSSLNIGMPLIQLAAVRYQLRLYVSIIICSNVK
jgi:hypothetical protein